MPKELFLRLDAAKQQVLVDAAVSEFSDHRFEDAKVTRICAAAGIPRVTFYSYFESLNDIYRYIFTTLKTSSLCQPGSEDFCQSEADALDLDYFINLVKSRRGIQTLSRDMQQYDPSTRIFYHLCISLALQYEYCDLSKEALEQEYRALLQHLKDQRHQ